MFLDGGVRRGTDALKALALGAAGVFVSGGMMGMKVSNFHPWEVNEHVHVLVL